LHGRQARSREGRRAVEHGRIGANRRVSLADQHEREMRERREIAARPDGPAARHDGMHPRVERGDQQLERRPPDPRVPFRQDVGAQRHHRAHRARRQGRVDARRVAAQQVPLERAQRVPGNLHFRQRSESRVDAVHRRVASGVPLDDRARRLDRARRRGIERDRREAVGYGFEVGQRQRRAIEQNHGSTTTYLINGRCVDDGASEHRERASGAERAAKRRASDAVGESEGRSPSERLQPIS
jgi:hypothetical protein